MKLPWMPVFVGDELAETAGLSAEEFGAYLLLQMSLWLHGALPDDDARLARITRLDARGWAAVRPVIEPLFGPGWTHEKLEERRRTAEAEREKKSEAGRKAALARWNDTPARSGRTAIAYADAHADALPTQSGRNALHPHPQHHLQQQRENQLAAQQGGSGDGRTMYTREGTEGWTDDDIDYFLALRDEYIDGGEGAIEAEISARIAVNKAKGAPRPA
ncbi:MAG: DUF1376 domain-containing protein [Rhizobiales bacterium]|nr:DUF1376 domain-containing protein [Hyphomicrobiales bacterium]